MNTLSNRDDRKDGISVIKIGKPGERILLEKETAEGFRYIFSSLEFEILAEQKVEEFEYVGLELERCRKVR